MTSSNKGSGFIGEHGLTPESVARWGVREGCWWDRASRLRETACVKVLEGMGDAQKLQETERGRRLWCV